MFKSNVEEDGNTCESDKEPLQFKPHHPFYVTLLCHATASSASDDLLVIHTPTTKDTHLKALVDSGATKNLWSDSYAREKLLPTHSLASSLRIRLADGSMSMARHVVNIEFDIDSLKIS